MSKVNELFTILASLIDYDDNDWKILQQEATQISAWIPEIIDIFYDTLYNIEETRQIFNEGEKENVEKAFKNWLFSLTSQPELTPFWNHQWFIALLHVKRGVKNLYMLGMMNRIQQLFLAKCLETYDKDHALKVATALLRITGAIATLIAECYGVISESSTQEGLSKVGVNPKLLQRIKESQISKMLNENQFT